MKAECVVVLFYGLLSGVFGVIMDNITSMSATKGESVLLNTGVIKQHDTVLWYFGDTLIAQINGEPSNSCVYDGEGGRFRDQLKVDYETGSLNITDIRPEHAGHYEAKLIRGGPSSESLNREPKCDSTNINGKNDKLGETIKIFNVIITGSGLSSAAIVGICVAVAVAVVLMIVAVGICCCR